VFTIPTEPRILSPIVNDNHFASLMALAVPLAIALTLSSAGVRRGLWFGAALLCSGMTLLIASRGGTIGLLTGIVATVALLVAQRLGGRTDDRRAPSDRQTFARLTVAGCMIVLVAALTATQVMSELSATRMDEVSEPHSKFQVWVRSLDMLEQNAWLGIGRGAFEPAFTPYAEVGDVTYSHAENSYLQTALDWGIPGAAALAIAAVTVVIALTRRWKQSALEAGAIGAVVSIAVHELADFSLDLPIVAMMLVCTISILLPTRVASTKTSDGRPQAIAPRTRAMRLGLLGAGVLICLIAATPLGRLSHAESTDPKVAESLTSRHPADYLLLGRAAQVLVDAGDPRAARVMTRALAMNPNNAGLHHVAARMLVRTGHPSQARVELSLALRFASPKQTYQLLDEIAATFSPDDAAMALPLDPVAARHLVDFLRVRHFDAIELAYAMRVTQLAPQDEPMQLILAQAALRASRPELAFPAAQRAYQLHPDAASATVLARAAATAGQLQLGIETLRAAKIESPAERIEVLRTLADLELAGGRFETLQGTLDELAQLVTDDEGKLDLHRRRAELAERRGNVNQAGWEREQMRVIERGHGP